MMGAMHRKLTPKYLESLPPAKAKRYEVRDEIVPGLVIRLSSTGRKIWYLSTRVGDKTRRIKIGTYPVLSLADAREAGRGVLRGIQLGKFLMPEPVKQTFRDVATQFIELYAKPRNRTWKSTERVLTKFSSLNYKPIADIKRADIVRVLDGLIAAGMTVGVNRALAAIKKLFAWCVDRGLVDHSPIAGLRPPAKEVSRERVLSDDELLASWRAAEREGFPFEHFLKLLLLTGQRRGEVAGMRWSEIDFEKSTWTIPGNRAKNAKQHAVPLALLAVSILKETPRFFNSDFVFTTTGRTPISGFGRLKRRLGEKAGDESWRLHDLRRTVATGLAELGIRPHVIEAVLNHRSGIVSGVAAVYNRHTYLEDKREALRAWCARVATLIAEEKHGEKFRQERSVSQRQGSSRIDREEEVCVSMGPLMS
jgi:integrase